MAERIAVYVLAQQTAHTGPFVVDASWNRSTVPFSNSAHADAMERVPTARQPANSAFDRAAERRSVSAVPEPGAREAAISQACPTPMPGI